jgi:hypothetical protein
MELTAKTLRDLLSYEPETGEFRWKKLHSKMRLDRLGAVAGCAKSPSRPYRQIAVMGKLHYAHRLAWLYVHGTWPAHTIDHINRNPADNRIANLREASGTENIRNMSRHRDNKSGYTGVRWHAPSKLWQAYISANKTFKSLGYYKTPEEAAKARLAEATKTYGEFHPQAH